MGIITTISDDIIIKKINTARNRVYYAAPGISAKAAKIINESVMDGRLEQIEVIIDANPEVCRLGYGEIEAIELLNKNGIKIRKSNNLRIGLLIVDHNAWVFTPTPLVIEKEQNLCWNNAVAVNKEQIELILQALCSKEHYLDDELNEVTKNITAEIGEETLEEQEIIKVKKDLELLPPQKFDTARRVRVYHSYIQFVELSLKGCNLKRHTISIPPQLMGVGDDLKVQERIRTTYKLVNEDSEISGKVIGKKITQIRKEFIKSLGTKYGNVILVNKKEKFEKKINSVREELKEFQKTIEKNLKSEFQKSKDDLINMLLPGIIKNPPPELYGGIMTEKPTEAQSKKYLECVLDQAIPSAESFVKDMEIHCYFKDVTYEMLNEEEFVETLIKAYPYVEWPKLFEEYDAAREVKENNQQMVIKINEYDVIENA